MNMNMSTCVIASMGTSIDVARRVQMQYKGRHKYKHKCNVNAALNINVNLF